MCFSSMNAIWAYPSKIESSLSLGVFIALTHAYIHQSMLWKVRRIFPYLPGVFSSLCDDVPTSDIRTTCYSYTHQGHKNQQLHDEVNKRISITRLGDVRVGEVGSQPSYFIYTGYLRIFKRSTGVCPCG